MRTAVVQQASAMQKGTTASRIHFTPNAAKSPIITMIASQCVRDPVGGKVAGACQRDSCSVIALGAREVVSSCAGYGGVATVYRANSSPGTTRNNKLAKMSPARAAWNVFLTPSRTN